MTGYNANYMKEGYLQKKGQRLKGWKQRWFICDGRTLSYYITPKDRRPNAMISLDGCTVQDGGLSETWQSPRIYLTDGSNGIMYCLSAEESDVVIDWLRVLRNAVNRLSNSNASKDSAENLAPSDFEIGSDTPFVNDGSQKSRPANEGERKNVHQNKASVRVLNPRRLSVGRHEECTNHNCRQNMHTSVALENEISCTLETLNSLFNNCKGAAPVTFFPVLNTADCTTPSSYGALKSIGVSCSGKMYGKISLILPVTTDVAGYLIMDNARRSEWDAQFPVVSHVAKLDDCTTLIHIRGGLQQIRNVKLSLLEGVGFSFCNILICVITGVHIISCLAFAGVIFHLLTSIDWSPLVAPRDLLLLQHCRERSAIEHRRGLSSSSDFSGESVITILEKSVINELKPCKPKSVRADVQVNGWQLEPLELGRTLCTFITDIDPKGWLNLQSRRQFLKDRLDCAALLHGYASQISLGARDYRIFEDRESVDGDSPSHDHGDQDILHDDGSKLDLSSPAEVDFHPSAYLLGMEKLPTGVLKLTDKEVARKQSGVLKEVIKSAGAKILEGKSTVSLSLPVRIFETRTNLERIVDLFLYAPTFLNAAAEQQNPVERLKFVIAFAVAGIHHGIGQLKPFNPILGETYQAQLNDGTEVACEHTSHHPPISNYQLVGKNYTITGHVLWGASFSMKSNALIQTTKGPVRITFADGTIITFILPQIHCGGFLWGERTIELAGSMIFDDPKHHLSCDLRFNPDKKEGMSGIFLTSKTPADSIRGHIINTETTQQLFQVSGSWLDELVIEDKLYWKMNEHASGHIVRIPENKLLPSDSRFREDLRFLAKNDLQLAQEWKLKLEVLQRSDRSLRAEGRKSTHWTFKSDSHAN